MTRSDEKPLCTQYCSDFDGMTLEQKIKELTDREEIRELIGRYAQRAALGISMADMFTEDGYFILRNPGQPVHEMRGMTELMKGLAYTEPGRTIPMVHNITLSLCGDEGTGLCSIETRLKSNGQSLIASGYYSDRYRRVNGRWMFAGREYIGFHIAPIQKGWADQEPLRTT